MSSDLRGFAMLCVLILPACAAPPPPRPASARPAPAPLPPRCDASAAKSAIGQTVDASVLEKARAAAGADMARALRADRSVGRDYRAGRLNLHLDASGRVINVSCG